MCSLCLFTIPNSFVWQHCAAHWWSRFALIQNWARQGATFANVWWKHCLYESLASLWWTIYISIANYTLLLEENTPNVSSPYTQRKTKAPIKKWRCCSGDMKSKFLRATLVYLWCLRWEILFYQHEGSNFKVCTHIKLAGTVFIPVRNKDSKNK